MRTREEFSLLMHATGPASVVEAIGAGKRAATSIDRYLNGQDLRAGRDEKLKKSLGLKTGKK